jgi:hypothetical protein
VHEVALDRQVADAGSERQVEELGELRADLAGVGVDVSEPANATSVTRTPFDSTPRSSAQATASRNESSALGGPNVTKVTRPPCWDASSTAWATARRQ